MSSELDKELASALDALDNLRAIHREALEILDRMHCIYRGASELAIRIAANSDT